MSNYTRLMLVLCLALLANTACSAPLVVTPVPASSAQPTAELIPVALGLGYIPSVQFAPFYVAQEKGFFAEQGLQVELRNGIETDFLKLVALNEIHFAIGSGDQVILGRAQGLPLTYVLTWYNQFPVGVMSLAEKNITTPQDLVGKTVGIPGMFGASLVAWKALVDAYQLDENAITLQSIGFTQAAAVQAGRVDAALDYMSNGPVQLRLAGKEVNVIPASDAIDLPSNGLITNAQVLAEQPEVVQKMTDALLAGIRYTLEHPDEAFAISLKAVPEAGGENEATNRAVFDASLALWQPGPVGLGRCDPTAWDEAAAFMRATGLIDVDVATDGIFTNEFVDAAGAAP